MASVLVLTKDSELIPLAMRLAQDGHFVKVKRMDRACLAGFTNPSYLYNPSGLLEQFDLVLSNVESSKVGFEERAEKVVVGGGALQEKLEDPLYNEKVVVSLLNQEAKAGKKHKEQIELKVSGWFDGSDWLAPHFLHLPCTRLMPGNLGPTKWMGSVSTPLQVSKFYPTLFLPLQHLLQKASFTGPFTISLVVCQDQLSSVWLSGQLHSSDLLAQDELTKESLFHILFTLGTKSKKLTTLTTLPFYSLTLGVYYLGKPLSLKVEEAALKHLHFADASREEEGFVIEGKEDPAFLITARGNTLGEGRRRITRTLANLTSAEEFMYRNDLGEDTMWKLGKLREWGWIDA